MIKEEINFGEKVYKYTDGKPLWVNDVEIELDKIYEKLINERSWNGDFIQKIMEERKWKN